MSRWACARCDFRPDPDLLDDQGDPVSKRTQLAEHAEGASHSLCPCCGWSLDQHDPQFACERCLSTAQAKLSGVVTMFLDLPRHRVKVAGGLVRGGGSSDGPPLPGGDVLVLMSRGSEGISDDGQTSRDNDPQPVAYVLDWWRTRWSQQYTGTALRKGPEETAHRPLTRRPSPARTVLTASSYLERRARWAANNITHFDQYLTDLEDLHARLERVTGRALRHQRANASCFDCDGPLIRRDDPDQGVNDSVTCQQCQRAYTSAEYTLALKARATEDLTVEHDGAEYSSIRTAARLTSRPERTIQSWQRLGLIRHLNRQGTILICLDDAWRESQARPTQTRRRTAS